MSDPVPDRKVTRFCESGREHPGAKILRVDMAECAWHQCCGGNVHSIMYLYLYIIIYHIYTYIASGWAYVVVWVVWGALEIVFFFIFVWSEQTIFCPCFFSPLSKRRSAGVTTYVTGAIADRQQMYCNDLTPEE